jgi:hypothetical protein
MVANWDYRKFDPLRTADEYHASFGQEQAAYAPYAQSRDALNQQFQNPGSYLPTLDQINAGYAGQATDWSILPKGYAQFDQQYGARLDLPSSTVTGMNAPPQPNGAALNANLDQLHGNQQLQQGNYNRMMGGGFAGGVLPDNMMQTYQSGGQFGADSRGIRPANPFAQSPSYGPAQAASASYGPADAANAAYGRQGGLGGLGGFGAFGTTEVFDV